MEPPREAHLGERGETVGRDPDGGLHGVGPKDAPAEAMAVLVPGTTSPLSPPRLDRGGSGEGRDAAPLAGTTEGLVGQVGSSGGAETMVRAAGIVPPEAHDPAWDQHQPRKAYGTAERGSLPHGDGGVFRSPSARAKRRPQDQPRQSARDAET